MKIRQDTPVCDHRTALQKKLVRNPENSRRKKVTIRSVLVTCGITGWTITIPVLIFLSIGVWCERYFNSPVSLSMIFGFIGFILGCLNAKFWFR
ncbi:MAG: hypothetical protein GX640_11785 [Fibrobacter sp.]|nr:hypothetical protein [Fibrobacter sp.]